MKIITACLAAMLVLFYTVTAKAQEARKPVQVLLLGTFHFDNPGLDVAKFEDANIMTNRRQKEVAELVSALKRFNPDKIFIEASPASQRYYDSLLQQYKMGKWKLEANEIYQVGFRLAQAAGIDTLHAVDYRAAQFPFDSLVKVLQQEQQLDMLQRIQTAIDSIQRNHNEQLQKGTIREILMQNNSAEAERMGVGFYFDLLRAGSRTNHVGSYLTSEWWRRNMIIYENILKRLDGREKKILVLFGSSHTALLKEFMKYNKEMEVVEVDTVL